MEEEEADLRDDLRGLPFGRIMLVAEDVRWIGGGADFAEVTEVGVAGEVVGKGTEGGSKRARDGGRSGEAWRGGEGGGEWSSCCSGSSSLGM